MVDNTTSNDSSIDEDLLEEYGTYWTEGTPVMQASFADIDGVTYADIQVAHLVKGWFEDIPDEELAQLLEDDDIDIVSRAPSELSTSELRNYLN